MTLEDRFELDVRGFKSVCYTAGEGPPLLLLHGTGPGASAATTWQLIISDLAKRFRVYAPDLIGFGSSGPMAGSLDPSVLLDQALAVLDRMPEGQASVFGHSLSGYTALRLPSRSDRIKSVLTTGTLGGWFKASSATELGWSVPRTGDELREVMAILVTDQSLVSDQFIDRRMELLGDPGYRSAYERMFGGDKQHYIDACVLTDAEIDAIKCKVSMVHGRADAVVQACDTSVKLAARIPHSDLHLLSRCGHLPAIERPDVIRSLALSFFQ